MPQNAWSNKRERQYEHIKESAKRARERRRSARSRSPPRTVNKERARKARARRVALVDDDISPDAGAASAPARTGPKGRTKEQLYNEAKRRGIKGRSRMTKQQLQRAIAGKS